MSIVLCWGLALSVYSFRRNSISIATTTAKEAQPSEYYYQLSLSAPRGVLGLRYVTGYLSRPCEHDCSIRTIDSANPRAL